MQQDGAKQRNSGTDHAACHTMAPGGVWHWQQMVDSTEVISHCDMVETCDLAKWSHFILLCITASLMPNLGHGVHPMARGYTQMNSWFQASPKQNRRLGCSSAAFLVLGIDPHEGHFGDRSGKRHGFAELRSI